MSLKTDYNFNEDDFAQDGDMMKELTVTITLCEYRNIIREQVRSEIEIGRLQETLKKAESQAKLMTDMVVFDHPEFYGDMVGAVTKFLKKMREPVSGEEDCNERAETM